jgi:hypothetical protein
MGELHVARKAAKVCVIRRLLWVGHVMLSLRMWQSFCSMQMALQMAAAATSDMTCQVVAHIGQHQGSCWYQSAFFLA